jgi:hypothetical protein
MFTVLNKCKKKHINMNHSSGKPHRTQTENHKHQTTQRENHKHHKIQRENLKHHTTQRDIDHVLQAIIQ